MPTNFSPQTKTSRPSQTSRGSNVSRARSRRLDFDIEMGSKFHPVPQEYQVAEAAILEELGRVDKGDQRIEKHFLDPIHTKNGTSRWIVFRKLHPTTDLVGAKFWSAFWECFRCHLRSWRAGIRHLDINVSNLLYDTDTGCGVLNDFDLALPRDHPSPTGTKRAGVMPFMALDLLMAPDKEVKREYRHDVESFAWVLLWICCTYENGRELPKRPFQAFIQSSFRATYMEKWAIELNEPSLKPTASYSWEYFEVALNLVMEHRMQHNTRINGRKTFRHFNPEDHRTPDPDPPESVDDELNAIDAELQICRERLASARLPVNLF